MRAAVIFALGGIILSGTAHAQAFCHRPAPPDCLRWLASSSQSWEFDLCRAQLLRYESEVRMHLDCLRQERQQVLDDLDAAIRRFNDCVRDRFC